MGHLIEEIAKERGHEIVARIDVGDTFDLKDADVAIEFTTRYGRGEYFTRVERGRTRSVRHDRLECGSIGN